MRKVTRKITNREGVRLLSVYLQDHFERQGVSIRVSMERYVEKRTLSQNALVHVWCSDIASDIGDSPGSVKDDLKIMFAPAIEGPLGRIRPKNTSEMTVPEMADFMTAIQAKGAQMGWELTTAA